MGSWRRKRPGRRRPVNGPRNACVAFWGVGVLGAVMTLVLLLMVAYAFPAATNASMQDMRDYVDSSSVIGRFLTNGIWIIFLFLGILGGVLHSWWKKEDVLQEGLEEWRAWRRG